MIVSDILRKLWSFLKEMVLKCKSLYNRDMEFLKPKPFILPKDEILVELGTDYYQIKQFGVELSVPFSIAKVSKDFTTGGNAQMDIAQLFNQDAVRFFYDIKMMTFHCTWLGESLFLFLKRLNDKYHTQPKYSKVMHEFIAKTNASRECKIEYKTLDFMGHKGLLSDILKENEKTTSLLAFKRKDFNRLFDSIIIQRNNFTHGELLLLHTEEGFKTLLRHNKGTEIIDMEVLNSYNECYNNISEALRNIEKSIDSSL